MVGLVDYGIGNVLSVRHALEALAAEVRLCSQPEDLLEVDRIVLPGVGAFNHCMDNLTRRGFIPLLQRRVIDEKVPFLGLCVGMQVLAKKGFEKGEYKGLGWLDSEVVRLEPNDPKLRVPHVGWNTITPEKGCSLFAGLPKSPDVYFVHSFTMRCKDASDVAATCEYGGTVTAAIKRGNIFATQFHPEKSQEIGLKILGNFLEWSGT